jgi:hypothetical protein
MSKQSATALGPTSHCGYNSHYHIRAAASRATRHRLLNLCYLINEVRRVQCNGKSYSVCPFYPLLFPEASKELELQYHDHSYNVRPDSTLFLFWNIQAHPQCTRRPENIEAAPDTPDTTWAGSHDCADNVFPSFQAERVASLRTPILGSTK